jgi:IMP dehydrogenase
VLDPAPLTLPLDTTPRQVFEALGPRGVALGLDADSRLAAAHREQDRGSRR